MRKPSQNSRDGKISLKSGVKNIKKITILGHLLSWTSEKWLQKYMHQKKYVYQMFGF